MLLCFVFEENNFIYKWIILIGGLKMRDDISVPHTFPCDSVALKNTWIRNKYWYLLLTLFSETQEREEGIAGRTFRAKIAPSDNASAEEELSREIRYKMKYFLKSKKSFCFIPFLKKEKTYFCIADEILFQKLLGFQCVVGQQYNTLGDLESTCMPLGFPLVWNCPCIQNF